MEKVECSVSPSVSDDHVREGFHDYDEVVGSTTDCGSTSGMSGPFDYCDFDENDDYITLKKEPVVEKEIICKRAKYIGKFPVISSLGEASESHISASVSKGTAGMLNEVSMPSCQPVSVFMDKKAIEMTSVENNAIVLRIETRRIVCVKPEPGHAVVCICTQQPGCKDVEAHIFKVTSPHEAKKIGNLLESRCVAKEKSHILSADSPTRSATEPCTKSCSPESASPDVHFSSHRQTNTISSFPESRPPPLPARSHPFLRNKSNTLVSNLTAARQELDEKSTQRRRLNSLPSSCKHESTEYGGNQQTLLKSKASTLGPATSQTLPAKKSVVIPPPIPTRQTCSDVETKISVLEEEIAKIQDELFRDKNILDSASKSQRLKEEDLAVMKVKLLAKQKSLQCKKDSLYRYQDLLKATIATSPDLASVKECYGKDWFKPDWNRKSVEKALSGKPTGSFFIRESSKQNSFALSVKDTKGAVVHHLIMKCDNQYHIKGAEHAKYTKLINLIFHLMNKKEVLPCLLYLDARTIVESPLEEADEEAEYVVPEFC